MDVLKSLVRLYWTIVFNPAVIDQGVERFNRVMTEFNTGRRTWKRG